MNMRAAAVLSILFVFSGTAFAGPKTSLGSCILEAADAAALILNRELPMDGPFKVTTRKSIAHLTGNSSDTSFVLRTIQYRAEGEIITFGSPYRYVTINASFGKDTETCTVTDFFLSPHSN